MPLVVGFVALGAAGLSLFNEVFRKPSATAAGLSEQAQQEVQQTIHMDLTSDTDHLPMRVVAARAARFFGYLIAFMASMAVIGLIPTAGLFVIIFMRLEGQERWTLTLTYAAVLVISIYLVFDQFMLDPLASDAARSIDTGVEIHPLGLKG